MKRISPSTAPGGQAVAAVPGKSSAASHALAASPRMLAQRKKLEGTFGPAQLAAKKDEKKKK